MKFPRTVLAPALVLSALLATTTHAQNTLPVAFEVRGGASIPTGDFADGVSTGWNLGGSVLFSPSPNLALYAGYQHDDFNADDDSEDVDIGVQDNGFRAGARLSVPLATGTVRPWVEGGLLYNRTTISGSDGEVSASFDSSWELGFEVGGGFSLDLTPTISLAPGIRYRQHKVDFGDIAEGATGDVKTVVVDLGINFHP
jgi:opacity protein-like surface antigen